MKLKIETMTCGGCARSVSKAIERVDPQAQVSADPPARLVDVTTTASAEAILTALDDAGFPAQPV